jgi:hypothetical protein
MVHQVASLGDCAALWVTLSAANGPCNGASMSDHLHPNLKLRRRTEVHFVNEIAGLTGSSRQTCPARHAQPVSSCYGYNLLCMYVCRLLHIGCIRMDIDIVNGNSGLPGTCTGKY